MNSHLRFSPLVSLSSQMQDIQGTVNVPHNCRDLSCTVTKTRPVYQEREKSKQHTHEVNHNSEGSYILNTCQMRNQYLLRTFRPAPKSPNRADVIFSAIRKEVDILKSQAKDPSSNLIPATGVSIPTLPDSHPPYSHTPPRSTMPPSDMPNPFPTHAAHVYNIPAIAHPSRERLPANTHVAPHFQSPIIPVATPPQRPPLSHNETCLSTFPPPMGSQALNTPGGRQMLIPAPFIHAYHGPSLVYPNAYSDHAQSPDSSPHCHPAYFGSWTTPHVTSEASIRPAAFNPGPSRQTSNLPQGPPD